MSMLLGSGPPKLEVGISPVLCCVGTAFQRIPSVRSKGVHAPCRQISKSS